MTRAARVVVVMGGLSPDRESSLRSGAEVLRALVLCGIDARPLVLSSGRDALGELGRAQFEVAFLALHGALGDGRIQGALELLGLPYTGCSVLSSALALDGQKAKEMFRLRGVPTPPYYVCDGRRSRTELEALHGAFGFPVIVKPRRAGSRSCVNKACDLDQLANALDLSLCQDSSVLVERFIPAKRIAVGLLDGRVLGALEIVSGPYDRDCKLRSTMELPDHERPVCLPAARHERILSLAQDAGCALCTSGPVIVDLLSTEGQNEYVLEVDTQPVLTETSLFSKIARAAGFDLAQLCEAIVRGAMLRFDTTPRTNPSAQRAELCPQRARSA